jgi:hypothetical protein
VNGSIQRGVVAKVLFVSALLDNFLKEVVKTLSNGTNVAPEPIDYRCDDEKKNLELG